MNIRKMSHRLSISVLLIMLSTMINAANIDVYIVYGGGDKKIQKTIKKALPSNLNIKSYNTSLLAMADYSGKQKAVAKISSASLVVIINEKNFDLLGKPTFSNSTIVTSDGESEIAKIKTLLPR